MGGLGPAPMKVIATWKGSWRFSGSVGAAAVKVVAVRKAASMDVFILTVESVRLGVGV